jgi:GNAT superfamily N-acetyltransferase
MSELPITLRPFGPQDGPAYEEVNLASPDTGSIGTSQRFTIDPYQALVSMQRRVVGVVAETPGHAGIIGCGLLRPGRCQWEGRVLPSALLNTLVVHPDYRRKGVASALAGWRLEQARQMHGEDSLVYAIIQQSNTGSERTAGKWASQFLPDRLATVLLQVRKAPPPKARSLIVRPAERGELAALAEGMNHFYSEYNLYPPESGESLSGWLDDTPFDTPFRHFRLITDRAGSMLGGIAISENYRLRTTIITRLPPLLRFFNRLFKLIPPNGEVREAGLSRFWHVPGGEAAARHLLGAVRWEWHEKATSMLLSLDVRNPLMQFLGFQDRYGREITGLAVKAPAPCSEGRLLYYA